jgi:hypothetical protein
MLYWLTAKDPNTEPLFRQAGYNVGTQEATTAGDQDKQRVRG